MFFSSYCLYGVLYHLPLSLSYVAQIMYTHLQGVVIDPVVHYPLKQLVDSYLC